MNMEVKDNSSVLSGGHNGGDHGIGSAAAQSERFEAKTKSKGGAESGQKSTNSKDPSRPRRKKARRACFACQRAHLTCGKFGYPTLFASKMSSILSLAFIRLHKWGHASSSLFFVEPISS